MKLTTLCSHAPVAALLPTRVKQFWGAHLSQSMLAFVLALHAMATVPTPIFCTSPHPCSCKGGGFDLYESFCEAAARGNETAVNGTSNSSTLPTSTGNITAAKAEYEPLFSFLGKDAPTFVLR